MDSFVVTGFLARPMFYYYAQKKKRGLELSNHANVFGVGLVDWSCMDASFKWKVYWPLFKHTQGFWRSMASQYTYEEY